ncbi:EMILIN-2 [Alosa sapidissima]|uniref:EMILIN-2 n=1 Tax=Alosa sapidissima TaxID=34773 RepID=UPI001C080323|nr:EMILIN-2 [Alosa sapidissima]
MKSGFTDFGRIITLIYLQLNIPLIYGTPSRYSMFQGNAYSDSAPRQRNKNWCAYVVHKNVTCAVLGATETVVEPELAPCPMHQPDCAQRVIYRTHLRPMYKIGYKEVTELEWKCCPLYQGYDCMELKGFPSTPEELRPNPAHIPEQEQSMLGPENFDSAAGELWSQGEPIPPWGDSPQRGPQPSHPWLQGGAASGRAPADQRKVRQLELEVQRLSQNLLDLQAAMTGMNANLRQDLQEDASKIFLSMLGSDRQPASALGAGTESIILPAITPDPLSSSATEQLQIQVNDLSATLIANTQALKELQGQVKQQDGQLRLLTNAGQGALEPPPTSNSANESSLKHYVDSRISALRNELLEGMEIKMADLKNSCEYKVMSVSEQCEEQETSYLSLAELLDSKETDLRKEIQDLRDSLVSPGTGSPLLAVDGDLRARLAKIEAAQRELQAALESQNGTLRRVQEGKAELEGRVELAERSAEVHCLLLEEKLRRERQEERQEEEAAERARALGNSSALEDFRRQLTTHQHLIHNLEEALNATADARQAQQQQCCREVQSLARQVEGLESSVAALNDSASLHAEELQQLSAACTAPKGAPRLGEHLVQRVTTLEDAWSGVDGRVASVEGVCGRLEPLSDSLRRIKDGLNKHVTGLWTCVKQMNGTLRSHTRDLHALYEHTHALQDTLEQTTNTPVHSGHEDATSVSAVTGSTMPLAPVLETGEAGPPGTKHASRPPHGANGSMTPVKGYAGAPGYPPLSPVSHTPDSPSGHEIKLETAQTVLNLAPQFLFDPISFSAGLTLLPFPGSMGIIRFNKILINDGGHYDPHTGIFTVPVDGRYLLSAVVTAERTERVEAVLSVSNHNVQRLNTSSGGVATDSCLCGGSASLSLILDLKRGDRVGLVMTSGKLAVSASSEIVSSFSAVLLYPAQVNR